ncbi:MAG: sensor histidine kinase [Prevotella sp.]
MHVSQVTTQVSVDSTEKAYNPADTVATMLRAVQHKAEDTRHGDIRRLDKRITALLARGKELNERLNGLMNTFESEERMLVEHRQTEQKAIERSSARTISGIAVAAVLLAVFFFIIIWRDITKSNHYRRELEKAKQKAEDLLEQREQLMLTITHDIKAPVGSLIGYADLLKTGDSKQQTYIDSMEASAGHLLDMVTSLLDYHRLDANKMDVNKRSFSPHRLFTSIYDCFLPLAKGKQLTLDYQCDGAG